MEVQIRKALWLAYYSAQKLSGQQSDMLFDVLQASKLWRSRAASPSDIISGLNRLADDMGLDYSKPPQ